MGLETLGLFSLAVSMPARDISTHPVQFFCLNLYEKETHTHITFCCC